MAIGRMPETSEVSATAEKVGAEPVFPCKSVPVVPAEVTPRALPLLPKSTPFVVKVVAPVPPLPTERVPDDNLPVASEERAPVPKPLRTMLPVFPSPRVRDCLLVVARVPLALR